MPGATPVFGIRYPVLGDPITTAVFQNEATDIEAALATVDALATARLNRPYCQVFANILAPAIVVNVETLATFNNEFRDTDNMFTLASPQVLTVQTAGIWLFHVDFSSFSPTTTTTSVKITLSKNSQNNYSQTKRGSGSASAFTDTTVAGLFSCAVGDLLQVKLYWNGTGGPANYNVLATATLVCSL